MILLAHLLLGALIGEKINNPVLAAILAFLSHYFLDIFPHVEYSITNMTSKDWKKFLPVFLKIFLDFSAGIILIFTFSTNREIIYISAFFAILPDGFSILNLIFKNKILAKHSRLHQEKLHYFKYKKISNFWRIFNQVAIVVICILLLKF